MENTKNERIVLIETLGRGRLFCLTQPSKHKDCHCPYVVCAFRYETELGNAAFHVEASDFYMLATMNYI